MTDTDICAAVPVAANVKVSPDMVATAPATRRCPRGSGHWPPFDDAMICTAAAVTVPLPVSLSGVGCRADDDAPARRDIGQLSARYRPDLG
ncbi:hypothetical protein ACGFK1_23885 [Mycobacterium sp. NPDC048908]|uniref:hypothetical protein n=1 Tax=Mycobacterium sp. NPDC048908 TaxID=3364292 RepID=UPI00371113B3